MRNVNLNTSSGTLLLMAAVVGGAGLSTATVRAESAVHAVQQSGVVRGTVFDSNGEPIIGATVAVKGVKGGVITDLDGNFELKTAKPGDILIVSYIGYQNQEVKVGAEPLKIIIKEDTKQLDDVVVVGFGTQKKVNLTGSVSVVDNKALEDRPVNNAVTALQGVVPGLNITTGGKGGLLDNNKSVDIRGTGTIGNSSGSPLVLIDGMEGDLNSINPQDIENISVLKDAAASSIYGSRAPFGVILVTTKSGKEGKVRVNYNNSFRYKTPLNMPDMMNSLQFIAYNNDA